MFTTAIDRQPGPGTWQANFVTLLPEIERRLGRAFCRLDPEAREESLAEGVAHCLVAYRRLAAQGRADVATPSTLAWYGSRHVQRGRPAAGRMNSQEPLSRYGQLTSGIRVARRPSPWIDALVADQRASVPDQVAARIDVAAWFATLTERLRQIAKDLAFGCSTSEVARKHGVSPGRISQLRRLLEESWVAFQGEAALA